MKSWDLFKNVNFFFNKLRFETNLEDEFILQEEYGDIKMQENELEGFFDWKGRVVNKKIHGGIHSTLFVYCMKILSFYNLEISDDQLILEFFVSDFNCVY